MEAAVESISELPSSDNSKLNEACEKPPLVQEDTSLKSNGVAESATVVPPLDKVDNIEENTEKADLVPNVSANSEAVQENASNMLIVETAPILSNSNVDLLPEEGNDEKNTLCEAVEQQHNDNETAECIAETETVEETKENNLNDVQMEEIVESENMDTVSNENVRFETEILVESNDVNEVEIDDSKTDDSTKYILSDLGSNIELSEVLRSSDVTENANNNNCAVRQEVFNKEELLDILEGNDIQSTPAQNAVEQINTNSNTLEAQMALEQLSRLKKNKRGRHTDSVEKKKPILKPKNKEDNIVKDKEENIVKALVRDWDDEDLPEDDGSKINNLESKVNETETSTAKEETPKTNRASVDSVNSDGQTPVLNKSTDDSQPQRRLGRVIKKKVIFDPDNPDTYAKSKTHKNKEPQNEKELQPTKKIKIETGMQRANSKSPISKMQWKKPQPKNNKQIKRLSEVDKLLMDEGAVNMIYQLTPEAPKGKKNMKTKAEFIKKLQSSTPEGKEMKFRERKKECMKGEEGEAKKILGGKQRSSLSSVKSPSACDDFETHSADDSIIYRRHSSSSYSSSCMSPRRLSDVDTNAGTTYPAQPLRDQVNQASGDGDAMDPLAAQDSPISTEIINRDDCLSIKKKLNSKLSLALNKRKRESSKTDKDKPTKRKLIKNEGEQKEDDIEVDVFKYLSITFCKGVAKISVRKTGSKYNADMFYELEEALSYVDRRNDISLTLMTSECGTLCSDLDLTPLLDSDVDKRTKNAQHIAESVRSVLSAVSRHSKVVCAGVWGACRGVGLALAALSDVALATEDASFAAASQPRACLTPGLVAVLGARCLPQTLVNDLVIFKQELSASEALQKGLINRVLWPTGVEDQLHNIVSDIANQPIPTLLLKKKLLKLRSNSDNTFLAQLEAERALFVEYWSSGEGLAALISGN